MLELINLAAFFGLTVTFHWCGEKLKHRFPTNRITAGHKALLAGALSHPITWDALHHYAVHVVVYSGYFIPKH